MTFDELWRLNLAQELGPVDLKQEAETAGRRTTACEYADELLLTAEDRVFLLQVGIKL